MHVQGQLLASAGRCIRSDPLANPAKFQSSKLLRSACGTGHTVRQPFAVDGSYSISQRPVTHRRRTTVSPDRRKTSSVACSARSPRSKQLDTAMIWGDILMLTATELASERLPKHLTGVLSLTLLAAWIGVATAKGDYTMKRGSTFSFQYAYNILLGMQQAAITWMLFVPTAMAMYACLVSHHLLDSGVFKVPPGARLSPEGEVMIAALFTLMSWRGIYSAQLF